MFSKALDRSTSATARDCVSLALVRFAHENAAARLVPAVLAGRGDGRGGLAPF